MHSQKKPFLDSLCCLIIALGACAPLGCDSDTESESIEVASWDTYEAPPPSEALQDRLMNHPAIYPYEECLSASETVASIPEQNMSYSDDGTPQLCVWHHPAGCVPEGLRYPDVMSCDDVRTNGPSWFIPPTQKFVTDPSLMEDQQYKSELKWVKEQVASSACSCCHSSQSGYASFFDIDAPGAWIDTLTMTGIVMAAGLADEHKYLGYLPPDDNHGFDRETTIFATTDIPRMRAFFNAEFERRQGTEEDISTARQTFIQINGGLFMEPTECGVGEGVDEEGHIIWKGDNARQVYIQEVGSNNPGSPPNLDKPEGTVWAVYANTDTEGLVSGTITPGIAGEGARQAVPEDVDTEAVFEDGKTYRLFVTPDFLRVTQTNCTFTFGEVVEPPVAKTCESDQTLCTTLKIPETLSETPEKLLVALYLSLPPLGPPDVFPPFSIDEPELDPGSNFDVLMDANAEGPYLVYAVLYMPGGGLASWQPVAGVDYVAASETITLDGNGMTLPEPLVFKLAE